jgi:hypothetical protein
LILVCNSRCTKDNLTASCRWQVDLDGKRHELAGEYTFSFGVAATAAFGGAYSEHTVMTY